MHDCDFVKIWSRWLTSTVVESQLHLRWSTAGVFPCDLQAGWIRSWIEVEGLSSPNPDVGRWTLLATETVLKIDN